LYLFDVPEKPASLWWLLLKISVFKSVQSGCLGGCGTEAAHLMVWAPELGFPL